MRRYIVYSNKNNKNIDLILKLTYSTIVLYYCSANSDKHVDELTLCGLQTIHRYVLYYFENRLQHEEKSQVMFSVDNY